MFFRLFWTALMLVGCCASAHAGFIEICKDSNPAGAVSGLFNFTIAGQPGTFPAPVGACTPAIQLPVGTAFITEVPKAGSALFSVFTFPVSRLDSFNLLTGVAQIEVVAGDISTQTLITFVNAPAAPPAPLNGVPEPETKWLFGLGLCFGLWAYSRRKRATAG